MENTFMIDLREWENDPGFLTEDFILELNEQICEWMEKQNISRSELARRLGKSRAYVTRMLNGSHNLTVGTLVKVAHALGAKPKVHFVDIPSMAEVEADKENAEDSVNGEEAGMIKSAEEAAVEPESMLNLPEMEENRQDLKAEKTGKISADAA